MSRLQDATQRLDTALDRLERAVARRAGQSSGESEALRAALAKAEAETASLHDVTDIVSDRLDSAIERLRTVLER